MIRLLSGLRWLSGVAVAMKNEVLLCPFDGKPCDGVWILGAPSCSISYFGFVKGKGRTCPRFKERKVLGKEHERKRMR